MGNTNSDPTYLNNTINDCQTLLLLPLQEQFNITCNFTHNELVTISTGWKYNQDLKWVTANQAPIVDNYILPPVGIICNSLLLLTLLQKSFSGSSCFWYLRIIAMVEMMRTVLVIVHSILYYILVNILMPRAWINDTTDFYFYTLFFNTSYNHVIIYQILKPTKMIVSTLSLFLAGDRLAAVASPDAYTRVSNKKFITFAFFASLFISAPGFIKFADYYYTWDIVNGTWRMSRIMTEFKRQNIYFDYIQHIPNGIHIAEALLMVVLTVAVIAALRRRRRKVLDIMASQSAKIELERMAKIVRFQLIEAAVITSDLVAQIAMDIPFGGLQSVSSDITRDRVCSVPFHLQYNYQEKLLQMFRIFPACTQKSTHFLIFILYLIFNRMFRQEFIQLWKNICTKCKCF